MKLKIMSLLAILMISTNVFAQSDADAKAAMNSQKEAWERASTPGEEHRTLQRFVGNWNHSMTWWMTADATPETSKGKSKFEMTLGGRFLKQHTTGMSMGKPFEGVGITGFDNLQKNFSTIWMDNMNTAMMVGKGQFNDSKTEIHDQGSMSCPMSPTGTRNYRSVWTLPKQNTFKYEMFMVGDDGKEFRAMEINYTKTK